MIKTMLKSFHVLKSLSQVCSRSSKGSRTTISLVLGNISTRELGEKAALGYRFDVTGTSYSVANLLFA